MRRFTTFILTTVSATALAVPAYAQDAEATAESTAQAAASEADAVTDEVTNAQGQPSTAGEIVVTGSRIRRNNFNTPAPVNIYNREDTVLAGATGIADTLQSSAVTSGTSQISDAFLGFLTEGGQGTNTVGLRGLGSQRTLVLLNGRRLAPAVSAVSWWRPTSTFCRPALSSAWKSCAKVRRPFMVRTQSRA